MPAGYQAALTALKTSIELAEQVGSASEAAKQIARLTAKLAADPKDLAARFDLALAHYATGDREAAIDQLMDILRRDRKWREEAAKTQLLKIFDAMGADDPLTLASRRKMSAVLFS